MRPSTPDRTRSATPTRHAYVDATRLGYDVQETRYFQRQQQNSNVKENPPPSRTMRRVDSLSSSHGMGTPRSSRASLHTLRSGNIFLKLYESGLEKQRRDVETASEHTFQELDKVWSSFRSQSPTVAGQRPWNNSVAAASRHAPKPTELTTCPWRARQRQIDEESERRNRQVPRSSTPPPVRVTESFRRKVASNEEEARPTTPKKTTQLPSDRICVLAEPKKKIDSASHQTSHNRTRPVLDRKLAPPRQQSQKKEILQHQQKQEQQVQKQDEELQEPSPIEPNHSEESSPLRDRQPTERLKSVSFREECLQGEEESQVRPDCTTPENVKLDESDMNSPVPVEATPEPLAQSPSSASPNGNKAGSQYRDLAIDSSSSSSSSEDLTTSQKPKATQLMSILQSLEAEK